MKLQIVLSPSSGSYPPPSIRIKSDIGKTVHSKYQKIRYVGLTCGSQTSNISKFFFIKKAIETFSFVLKLMRRWKILAVLRMIFTFLRSLRYLNHVCCALGSFKLSYDENHLFEDQILQLLFNSLKNVIHFVERLSRAEQFCSK